jgi:regulator of sigma E protease
VMELLSTIMITLATLALLVGVHEYGHFWVARRCGVKVLTFSIGFGKRLFSWHDSKGTEYVLAAIPLGGYVKMLDEREQEVSPEERSMAFNQKTPLQRIAVVAAGPLANFALAIVAFWGLFLAGESGYAPVIGTVTAGSVAEIAGLEPGQEIVAVDGHETQTWQALSFALLDRIGDTGKISFAVKYAGSDTLYESEGHLDRWLAGAEEPNLFAGLGIAMYMPEVPPLIDLVVEDGAAERAGLLAGDLVLRADSQDMSRWLDWVDYVRARPEQEIELEYQRDGQLLYAVVVPEAVDGQDGEVIGRVGLGVVRPEMPPELIRTFDRNPLEAMSAAVERTGDLVVFTLSSMKKMATGLISPKNLSGPITIAKVAAASAKSGLESYISFLALLSVSLGVLNLLPIPVLDGGHLMYYLMELIAGRPVPEKIQIVGYQLGLFAVLGVMMLALYNDFSRL